MKSVATRPARRHIAAGALALTALLGATGCSAVSPIATGIQYSASDGTNQAEQDFVEVRNLGLVGEDASGPARVIGTLVNNSDADKSYTLSLKDGGSATVDVKAGETLRFEDEENRTELDRKGWPGEMSDATLEADGKELEFKVPILSATQEQYEDYLPEGQKADSKHLDEETLHYGGEGGH